MATTYSTTQVMMTMAALAATGATERPSGEPLAAHQKRILDGINRQLAMPGLATGGKWTATWVGLTANRANLAYLAVNPDSGAPVYALCLRGTMGGSPIDTSEDMQVGMMLPFDAGGTPPTGPVGRISQGAMEAFTDIVMGTNLLQTLIGIGNPAYLFVTGHSLGGALVTTISLWLNTFLLAREKIGPFTFAAPTAGDQNFAAWFDAQLPWAQCVVNHYDLIPNAWQTLASIPTTDKKKAFYPGSTDTPSGPGPTATPFNAVGQLILNMAKSTYGNSYVQPKQQPELNSPSGAPPLFLQTYPPGAATDLQQFEIQVGFQHDNNTYLKLLQAPPLPSLAPVVASIAPTSGRQGGGTKVTITPPSGVVFSPDSVVDFGIVPASSWTVAPDGRSITATAPPGVGTVDVRVTNMFGTSPAVPTVPNLTFTNYSDQYTYTATT